MWATNSVFYQIYPLGFCGAPKENDGQLVPRIRKVVDIIPHLKKLNIDAIYSVSYTHLTLPTNREV